MINVKRLLFPSEFLLDSSPTKSQYNWMCVIYSHKYFCLSYRVFLSICTGVCMRITLPFTSTFGGGDVKGVLHNCSTKPRMSPRFTWYTRVYYITPVRMYKPIMHLSSLHGVRHLIWPLFSVCIQLCTYCLIYYSCRIIFKWMYFV